MAKDTKHFFNPISVKGLIANGLIGSAGETLHSNGTATYWSTDDQGVTSIATANGLSGGPITTTGTIGVVSGSTLTVNTQGIHVNSALSITSLALAGAASGITTLAAGNTTITGFINTTGNITTASGSGKVVIATDSGGSISLGNTSGTATFPYIDFNTGATAVDFDARIAASGGSGVSGNGSLTITARSLSLGNTSITGFVNVVSDSAQLRVGNTTNFFIGNTSGIFPASNNEGKSFGATTRRWDINAGTITMAGSLSGVTTLAAGNTSITGFANVSTTLQVGGVATFAANANFDSGLLFVDGTNNRVGVNTTTPAVNFEVSSATGSATPTPTEMRISTTTVASDFSTTSPWGRFSFYSADTSDVGPKIQGSIDAISDIANGGRMSMVFNTSAATTGTLTERMRITSAGAVIAANDMRAPIFYDSADTSFYIDPASTSVLNALNVDSGTLFVDSGSNKVAVGSTANSESIFTVQTSTTLGALGAVANVSAVDTITDIISTASNHGWSNGQFVVLRTDGTSPGGTSTSISYYVNARTVNSVTLHTSISAALAGTSNVNITSAGTGNIFILPAHSYADFIGINSNSNKIKVLSYRSNTTSATLDWTTASSRLGLVTDSTQQGFVEFNPPGNNGGVAIGSGASYFARYGTSGTTLFANTTVTGFVNATSSVNSATLSVGTSFIANTTRLVVGTAVGLDANGGIGTAGQVLHSNGTTIYWDTDGDTTYDLLAVANTAVNAGILRLKDSSNANDDVTFTGSGTSNISSNATHIIISSADQYLGTVTSIATANGLSGGPITSTGTLGVTTGSTLTVNTAGIHVNSALSITDLTLSGNLTVSGTRTYVNTTTIDVGDNILTLNADLGEAAPSENAGIEIMRGTSANVQFIWDETNDRWSTNSQPLAISSLVAAGAASGITTLAAGNTTITGFANVSSTLAVAGITTFSGNVVFGSVGLSANGGFGTAGQVLHSNGTAAYWAADNDTTYTFSTGLTDTSGTITVNSAYIATISANNASFLGGTAAASYQLNSTLSANVATLSAAAVVKTVTGTTSAELVRGNMGDNDQARILIGATGTNAGYLEIATADDGTEPIYVRQYTGVFSTLIRTATLLDGSGNTTFPGSLSAGNIGTAATANHIVQRDSNGDDYRRYGFAEYFNMSHGASGATTDSVFYSSSDNYIRKNDATGFRASLNVPTRTGGDASGNWAINVTGSAGSLSDFSSYMVNRGSVLQASIDTATLNGFYTQINPSDSQGILVFNAGGSLGPLQMTFTYGGSMQFRNKTDSSTWTAFKTVLTNANYNSYAPTLTGTGASGTWGISVTGNAATVGGLTPSASAAVANRVVAADGNGYIFNNYFNSTDNSVSSGVSAVMVKAGDNYYRSGTAASIATFISGQTMNISGSATSATTATSAITPTFAGDATSRADITTRVDSGFYEHDSGTLAEGWPTNSGSWHHLLATTHSNDANYYSMQFASTFYDQGVFYRSTSGSGSTAWSRIALYDNAYGAELRATVFKDNNNTGYYVDADSESVLSTLTLFAELNLSASGTNYIDHTGTILFRNQTGYATTASLTTGGILSAAGDTRAPIFYDSNNTAYYLDPASTASNAMYVAGGIHVSGGNVGGNGIILADDGDIVDLNDGYCAMRFSNGVRVHAGNRSGSAVSALTNGGDIIASGNITAYGSPSDINLKYNIENIPNALEKLLTLNGVNFNYKKDGSRSTGVIAQEVEKVLPEVIYTATDVEGTENFKAVRYGNMVGLLIEAIKEQQAHINRLEQKINSLENK
jgi:hypothetical protein